MYPNRAQTIWLGGQPTNDITLLEAWREAPVTYVEEEEMDTRCNVDHYEVILGRNMGGDLFERAAVLALRNRFYPADVMTITADYDLQERAVQPGDLVLQRIKLFQAGGRPILEALTLNRITMVVDEPRRAGFRYVTTSAHSEIGEWTPVVEWRENDEVVLVMDVISRTREGMPAWMRRWVRGMQIRAHKRSIQNFQSLLAGGPAPAAAFAATPATLAPYLLPLIAGLLGGILLLGLRKRK